MQDTNKPTGFHPEFVAYCCVFMNDWTRPGDPHLCSARCRALLPVDRATLLEPALTPAGAERLMRAAPCSLQRWVGWDGMGWEGLLVCSCSFVCVRRIDWVGTMRWGVLRRSSQHTYLYIYTYSYTPNTHTRSFPKATCVANHNTPLHERLNGAVHEGNFRPALTDRDLAAMEHAIAKCVCVYACVCLSVRCMWVGGPRIDHLPK
jgi:hypothetical protein